MKLRRRFSSSLRPLVTHRMRALLALSGVAVGVAAVIVSRAIGAGAEQQMRTTIERTGTNLLIIKPVPVKRLVSRPQIAGLATTLDLEDYAAFARLPLIAAVAPSVDRAMRAKVGAIAMRTTVRGTTPAYQSIRGYQLAAGRFIADEDERAARRVAVLGARVADELGHGVLLLGGEIRIAGVPFEIIGVLRAKGATVDGADQDNLIVVPLRTALRRMFNTTWLTAIYVSVAVPEQMDEAATELQALLRDRHRRDASQPDDFAIQNMAKTRVLQQELIAALSRYAGGLAAIALGVGGSGILGLMLLSVRERTSEIGLRIAVGAQPRDILIQFLIESAALAVAGWLAGAAVGGAAALVVALGTSWPMGIPTTSIVTSLAMAVSIGLGFGALPARNAARIPPIEALLTR
ncbi:ABC transporter permease [Opitutus terrae]|uniref:ABC3 transporter permease protein domain-containing protein n=1 Tax=Opitutus terrae (strain DSM 11246 / JCM 15787 / PB90-1) TaxID=452637 RepID=B1ZQC9_OPITP|nr:ABC transporter permease [Opitutus terrae]ACB73609.1 protein of unknown function DUF214 [Opitutus terrae PB90-1]